MPERKARRTKILWIAGATIILLLNISIGFLFLRQEPLYDPIDHTVLRTVSAPTEVTDEGQFPTVHVTNSEAWPTVPLQFSTCTKQDTVATSDLYWRNTSPSGLTVPRGSVITSFSKGCTSGTSELAIPDGVRQRVHELALEGDKTTKWQLFSQLTPQTDKGKDGVPVNWQESGFVIVWDLS